MHRFASQTLLFKPDCRVFCAQGPGCRYLRGRNGAEHARLFIHTTLDVVKEAARRDIADHGGTQVINAPEANVAIPYIRQCWSMPDIVNTLSPTLPHELSGRTVLVWVHGFRQKFYPVLNIGSHLHHTVSQLSTHDPGSNGSLPIIMTFLWPACNNVLQYRQARSKATMAGARLKVLLQTLKAAGCRTVLMGHSMGCRVALHALLRESAGAQDRDVCEHLILVAAAVAANSLSVGGEFPRRQISATKITVVSSLQDDVLRDSFPIGESIIQKPVALGRSGPVEPFPPDVCHLDVSDSVPNHSPNLAILSLNVQRCMMDALGGAYHMADVSTQNVSDDVWSAVSGENLADEQSMSLEEDNEEDEES